MSTRRPLVLMGILLVLLCVLAVQSPLIRQAFYVPPKEVVPPPLPGKNAISRLEIKHEKGVWTADFDYYFTGAPPMGQLRVELPRPASVSADPRAMWAGTSLGARPERGNHHASVRIMYPGYQVSTDTITVSLRNARSDNQVLASQQIDQRIDWPDFQTWAESEQMAHRTPEQNLVAATALVDRGTEEPLQRAKAQLEALIADNPQFDAAYVQLARIALKTNWGPEGLHQAESLLASALQIRPDSADAKIVLGFVYANQRRFAQAEALFESAAAASSPNLWLWDHWGQLLMMEGKTEQAESKYREAIQRPMTHSSYDTGKRDAYNNLLALLEQRKDFDGMEALYKHRAEEFGSSLCSSTDYARFLLQVRGDVQGAVDLAQHALQQGCNVAEARQVMGLATYVKWATTSGTERSAALNQARIYLPTGPAPLYLLSTSERTSPVAKQLIASGEQIDQRDNDRMTALAYALRDRDLQTAKRLLTLGARVDLQVGFDEIPIAFIPVMTEDVQGVRLMRQSGVDYSKLRYQGASALDFAKQSGNRALLEALGRGGTAL